MIEFMFDEHLLPMVNTTIGMVSFCSFGIKQIRLACERELLVLAQLFGCISDLYMFVRT